MIKMTKKFEVGKVYKHKTSPNLTHRCLFTTERSALMETEIKKGITEENLVQHYYCEFYEVVEPPIKALLFDDKRAASPFLIGYGGVFGNQVTREEVIKTFGKSIFLGEYILVKVEE